MATQATVRDPWHYERPWGVAQYWNLASGLKRGRLIRLAWLALADSGAYAVTESQVKNRCCNYGLWISRPALHVPWWTDRCDGGVKKFWQINYRYWCYGDIWGGCHKKNMSNKQPTLQYWREMACMKMVYGSDWSSKLSPQPRVLNSRFQFETHEYLPYTNP
jgi:hypothetical protein